MLYSHTQSGGVLWCWLSDHQRTVDSRYAPIRAGGAGHSSVSNSVLVGDEIALEQVAHLIDPTRIGKKLGFAPWLFQVPHR
jgi:hypothetical protein